MVHFYESRIVVRFFCFFSTGFPYLSLLQLVFATAD